MENATVEQLAEQIYTALLEVVRVKTSGLLVAVADIREGLPFPSAAVKTREVFYRLAENLTRMQNKS
jgi:DNA-directed RNA polymerase specialized sigma54-like protein